MPDSMGIRGIVIAEWHRDGKLWHRSVSHNLVTEVGDTYYGNRASGAGTQPAQVTGMKLGTGSTAAAKTGAGAALVTYLPNSHQALDTGFPASALNAGARRISWQAVWAAGKATTASNITEVVLVNETLTDAIGAGASVTIARALLASPAPKAAGDVLTITWHHDLAGT